VRSNPKQESTFKERMLRELRDAVYQTNTLPELAYRLQQELGWKGDSGGALSYTSHMLHGRKHFPVHCLPLVYEVTGRDLTGVLQLEQLRIQMGARVARD
jgi:hypothetical protein